MSVIQALVLGSLQGLTEFLPISSSGHLIILPTLLGWDVQSLVFDTTLHLGTALALIVYFWKDLWEIVLKNKKLGYYILVGSIPAALVGFALEDLVETTFRGVFYVSILLLLGSFLMLVAEKLRNWTKGKEVDMRIGFLVGVFQALALLPGISRSGATISGGMMLGLSREKAAKFSFLLSIPVVIGAGLFKVYSTLGALNGISYGAMSAGFVSSFIVGLISIRFMLAFLRRKGLTGFVLYRVLLSVALLILFVNS